MYTKPKSLYSIGSEDEVCWMNSLFKWVVVSESTRVGNSGTITLVTSPTYAGGKRVCVRKVFSKEKSIQTFLGEGIVDCSDKATGSSGPYIVMEQCDLTLLDLMREQNGLYEAQLLLIERLYAELDRAGISHNDANLGNVLMTRDPIRFD